MNNYITLDNKLMGFDDTQTSLIPIGAILIPTSIPPSQYPQLAVVAGNIVIIPLSTAQMISDNQGAIQNAMDIAAQSKGYDDIKSACAYASPIPVISETDPNFDICEKFRLEGNAFQQWMFSVWGSAYAYLNTVSAGINQIPTPAQSIAMMPPLPPMP